MAPGKSQIRLVALDLVLFCTVGVCVSVCVRVCVGVFLFSLYLIHFTLYLFFVLPYVLLCVL